METESEYGNSTNLYLNCSSRYSSKELLIKFSYFLKPYSLQIVTAFFLMLISTCLQLPIPFISRYIIDKVILLKDIDHFNIIIILIICVLVLCALSSFFEAYFLMKVRTKVLLDIRIKLFEHLQKLSINFFKQNKVGYLLSRMGDDVQSLNGLFADSLVSVIRSILTMVAGIICTMYLNPRLALIACSLLPLYVVKIYFFNRHLRNLAWDLKERYAKVQQEIQSLITGISLIKAFTAEALVLSKFVKTTNSAMKQDRKACFISILSVTLSMILSSVGPILVMWIGGLEVINGNLTIGGLVAFLSLLRFLYNPINMLVGLNLKIQKSLASADRIFGILDLEPDIPQATNPLIKDSFIENIEFRNVSFLYGSKCILKNIQFTLGRGEKIAILGANGSGKSTIASLLLRFNDPDKGKILIDEEDIQSVALNPYRQLIGYIAQDTFLLHDSILENLKLGDPEITENKMKDVLTRVKLEEFIDGLPDKADTQVGERGNSFSGGERQRISIARCMLKDPQIYILDEMTSHLDPKVEQEILKELFSLIWDKTVVFITHKLIHVDCFDKIILLDKGEIIAIGAPGRLYEESLPYRNYYDQYISSKRKLDISLNTKFAEPASEKEKAN